jgi:hypothetical protein
MPRELKKRGRRGEEKKRKQNDQIEYAQSKRQRTEGETNGHEQRDGVDAAADQLDYVTLPQEGEDGGAPTRNGNGSYDQDDEHTGAPQEQVFFGMLDEEEQEYFRRADEMLQLNNFADETERQLFLANVYREAEGKELKIANSQSCSRLMERLIQLSTTAQLKTLFQKFSGK